MSIFENYLFTGNTSGGLSLALYAKEDQRGGTNKMEFKNRFESLVVPCGLVSNNQYSSRLFELQNEESKLITEDLFDELLRSVQFNKKKPQTRKNKKITNKTKKK